MPKLSVPVSRLIPSADGDRDTRKLPVIIHGVAESVGASPNLDTVYTHQLDNSLYLQFRSGDVNAENWIRLPRLEQFFRDIAGLAYF